MAQSLEELSSIYLASTEGLSSTQRYTVTVDQEEPSTLTTASVTQEQFQVTEASEEQSVILELDLQDNTATSEQQQPASKHPRRKRITYDYIPADIKRKVVEFASRHGTRPAAQLFDINEPTIRYWKQKGFAISRGRKVTYGKELDAELFQGLMALKSDGRAVNVDQFTEYAKKTIDERRPDLEFKCSRGWLEKFFKRHNLALTKTLTGKVMDIVEAPKEEDLMFDENYLDELIEDVDEGTENERNTSMEGQFVPSHNLSESADQLVEQNMSEDLSPTANKLQLLISSEEHVTASGNDDGHSSSTTDPEVLAQQKAKMLHTMNILKRLKSNRKSMDTYQKQEVIDHAKQHGSRSAERKFGVPETTIRYWVKKITGGNKQSMAALISSPSSSSSSLLTSVSGSVQVTSFMSPGDGHTVHPHSDSLTPGGGQLNQNSSTHVDGEAEAARQVLFLALDKRLRGESVSFDELCDQALSFISRTNPRSAYSSTRKWVGQFLDLKIKDVLNIND